MLRRIFHIPFVCAAMAVVLLVAAVPHHHHDGIFCAEEIEHAGDGNEHETRDHGCCVAESEFTAGSGREGKVGGCNSKECGDDRHTHIFPLIGLYCSPIIQIPDTPPVETGYGELVVRSRFVDARSGLPRRAPPAILC